MLSIVISKVNHSYIYDKKRLNFVNFLLIFFFKKNIKKTGGNILIRKSPMDGSLEGVVGDFGLALSLGSISSSHNKHSAGTYQWMAPEQINPVRGQKITQSVDIYSFGVVVWEIATGKIPWKEELQEHVGLEFAALSQLVKDGEKLKFPSPPDAKWEKMQNIAMQCFEQDPSKRPTAEQIVQLLSAL